MATDYVLFIHGVNVRNANYAGKLKNRIEKQLKFSTLPEFISLFWGDVVEQELKKLEPSIIKADTWERFWFKRFRTNDLLRFVGDAALYISRHVGFKAIDKIAAQAFQGIGSTQADGRLHLVTHSWGTVILFDVLFSRRWELDSIPVEERELVQRIRNVVFGIGPDPDKGLRLASVYTMGSPILLFNLINSQGPDSSHNISEQLKKLLQKMAQDGSKLRWRNFVHPGDPIAWPLEMLLPEIVGEFADIEDVLTGGSGFTEAFGWILQGSFLSLVNGGSAHGSYWESNKVALRIAETIQQTSST